MARVGKYVGKSMKRKEDPRLIRGQSHYVDDIQLRDMHYMYVVRSPYAHAKIRRVDVSRARSAKGVVEILTGEDVRGLIGVVPCAAQIPDMKPAFRSVLAMDKVRLVGEPVAVVVANDRYAGRDAVDLVDVDYEPLPAVVDPEKAVQKNSPLLYDEFRENVAYRWQLEGGDVEKAFRQADRIIEQRLTNQRLIPVAMEPRGVVADYKPGEDQLTVWSSTQIPHLLRTQLAAMLGIPEYTVRVITPEVGGGFGSKLNVYAEEALAAFLARKLWKPVKWIESRRENFASTIHGRDEIDYMQIAVKRDGTVLGMKHRILADLGAYYQLLTPLVPTLTGLMLAGCYKIPAIQVEIDGVLTNKMATDAYRGAGRPEATYFVERAMDLVARELGKDPVEIRRKNFPRPEDFPYTVPTGLTYDSANYQGTLEMALKRSGYKALRRQQAALRKKGRHIGIGLSTYVEICAMGPSSAMPAGGWESCTVRVEPTGRVNILTGSSPHGQGQETTFSQIAADMLGIGPQDCLVTHGDTAVVPYGIGTFGSRATAVGGTAMYKSLEKLREKMAKIAGHILGVAPASLEFGGHRVFVKKEPSNGVAFGEVVGAAYVAKALPPGVEPGLDATTFFEPTNFTFPFGTHICVVEVDGETGDVKLLKYVAVDDCGRVINPMLVDGQVHGGIVQSVGQALLEEALYDEQGQLLTGEFTDYAIPRALHIPRIETGRTVTPSPVNPMGVKGVGEAGTIGATPCVINAVVDALSPFGVKDIDMPVKRERVWALMRAGQRMKTARATGPGRNGGVRRTGAAVSKRRAR
jgi:carbon-monoxide dehydrogenase large subunit